MALTFSIVLPARYASTRFPGKPLAVIAGKPLIEWVYTRAVTVPGATDVIVATDDRRIADAVKGFGGRAVMTATHATGTDRVAEVAAGLDTDVIVNLQGDEPVFDPALVVRMVETLDASADMEIATACHRLADKEEFRNPNTVKVVMDGRGHALYFSRAPIPHGASNEEAFRHVGVYAFRRDALLRFTKLPQSRLEICERLEQLRALEHGLRIGVVIADEPTFGVDVPDDVKNVERQITRIYTS